MNRILRSTLLLFFTMLFGLSYGQRTTFDFDANGGQGATELFGISERSSRESQAGDITTPVSATVGDITITVSPSAGSTPNRLWKTSYCVLRMYGGDMKISSKGKNITKIVFSLNSRASSAKWSATVDNGTLTDFIEGTSTEVTWTGDAKDIVLTVTKNTQFSKITVYTNGSESGGEEPTPTPKEEVANIKAFTALANGTVATLTLKDAEVLYSWTSNKGNTQTFVRDATGALMFYNTGLDLKAGQKLNGTVTLKRGAYGKTVEAMKADETNADGYTAVDGTVEPKAIALTEVSNNLSDLVKLSNVNIVSEVSDGRTNYYIESGSDKVQLFNGFHLAGYEPAEAQGVDIVGIVTMFKDNYQVQPITAPVATGIDAVGAVESDNAPVYNVSGQRVGAAYKGLVIKNGKKFIRR